MGGLGGRPEGRGRPMDEYTASFLKPPSNPDPRSKVQELNFKVRHPRFKSQDPSFKILGPRTLAHDARNLAH